MPFKKNLAAVLLAATGLVSAATQEQPTPYDLIRPVWPLTWDESVFDKYDTTVTKKHNMVPKKRTPATFQPNAFIPDTLNQAYLDAMNIRMSPIRINQAGYMESDLERRFYFVGAASTFEVVDAKGNSLTPKITGEFTPSGHSISSDWTIIAGTNAATNDQLRYQVDITGQAGMVQIGNIPQNVPTETRLRIRVGDEISSTFIVSDRVYSMVRSAALKFYGINRSGDGDSWFHPASHMKDGAGAVVVGDVDVRNEYHEELAGTLQGGYYDCGDHLKESQTQMYAFMVAAVMAAANPDADEDLYAYNQGETVNTDGIPDMLREAKHGADFVLRAFIRAKGVIDDMALSVGNFGSDHGWWGRPENSDNMPTDGSAAATDRGGPMSRTIRLGEIGSNIGGETAAGLAIVSKMYAEYDKPFADSCLMVAEKMYDFAKALAQGKSSYDGGKPFVNNKKAAGWSSSAYNGNNEFYDDLALASVALLYATGKKEYADDMIRTRNLVAGQEYMENCAGCFEGGWFVTNDKGFLKNGKNTSWANAYAYATYALYKLILADKNKAITEYGLTEQEWLNAIEDCVMSMIYNLANVSESGTEAITLPRKDPSNYMANDIGWKPNIVHFDPLWFAMFTDGTWIYNRYQAGNIFEVLAYADVTKDIAEKGITLPIIGTPDWKSDEMHQLGINQLNYLLGMNPWDVSYILGIGDKNDNHPHHRAANPEGKNQPGANYKYRPPVGALYGGVRPIVGAGNSIVPSNKSWEDYFLSETCIDAAATLVSSGAIAAAKFDRTAAPKVNVEIRHVSMDSAIVMVKLTTRGSATIMYGTAEGQYTLNATDGEKGIQHEIILRGLEKGTTYYFYALGQNAYVPENMTQKFMVDSTQTPYSFTTLNMVEAAEINNVTVCNLSGDTAEIMWYTPNGEYESKVYWDTVAHATPNEFAFNSGARNADVSGLPTKFHYVKIGGLKEQTTYYYMVESNGVYTNVNDKGELLKFTTPVGWYDFSVRTYQYDFDGLSFMAANIYNNESRQFDSLTLRLYFTAKPEEVERCATLFDVDICFAYDEAGFSVACENQRELRDLARAALPIRLEDTFDPKTGKYSYYFPVFLGSSIIKSQSRLRVDFGFSSGISNDGYKTCETLRTRAKKEFSKETGDWSWAPHTFLEDGADYDGMPQETKDFGDIDNEVPVNQFIAVYRKGEFIWGYSPSKQEMTTKRAHYEISASFDAPFNVSDGSYVELDQTSSTVYVKGFAHITEQGYITKIWANGVQLKTTTQRIGDEILMFDPEGVVIAHYNVGAGNGAIDSTGLWTLNIPVKMAIGSNKVDITIFAGPDPECEACTENGGCAFLNRSYFVQFTRGNLTAAALTIKDEAGNPIASPADPANTKFNIYLTDKDKAKYSGTLNVLVINNKKSDTLKVAMVEDANNPGSFVSKFVITALSIAKNQRTGNQISFFPGDEIQVIYEDPDDEEDVAKQTFYAEATYPTPQKILAQDTDCDNVADQLVVQFSSELDESVLLQSLRFYINGMSDTAELSLSGINTAGERDVVIKIPESIVIPETAAPTGTAELFLKVDGEVSKERLAVSDGILPQLISVTLLENPDRQYPEDTLMVAFNEPVLLASANTWPLEVQGITGAAITVIGKATTSNDGKSWMFAVTGNTDGKILAEGTTVYMKTGMASDKAFNALDPATACANVKITETPRPVPITLAEMRDLQGDGYPDELYMVFEKKLRDKDMLDSFNVVWGYNGTTLSFKPESWTHSVEEVTHEEDIIDKDSTSATYGTVIGTQPVTETVSIITIQMDASNGFPKGSTSGPNDGLGGRVTPRLGPEGGFFDVYYSVADKCPPIIMSASKETKSDFAYLTVKMSEPLSLSKDALTSYIERKRTGNLPSNSFIAPLNVIDADTRYTFSYKDEADDAIRIGDQIRLVYEGQNPAPRFSDKSGNYATDQNPWVTVVGSTSEKTRFIVTINQNLGQENGFIPAPLPLQFQNYPFVLSVLNSDGGRNYLENDHNHWSVGNTISAESNSNIGPVFNITVVIPSAALSGTAKEYFYDYEMNMAVDVYDNLGQFINNQVIKIDASNFNVLRKYINENGEIKLSLEWVAKDNDAPVSADGKKIGTGPYIAKFDFNATSFCTENVESNRREDGLSCQIGKNKKETDSKTKTFGFKRNKRR